MSLLDTASLLLTPNAYKEGKLYSVIPSDGSGDFTFTRATTATRVNSDGLVELVPYNLLQRSEEFDNAYWTKTNTTITANAITSPNGTLTADKLVENTAASSVHYVRTGLIAFGSPTTASIYMKADGRDWAYVQLSGSGSTAFFNLISGVVGTVTDCSATITNVGDGWYRCTIADITVPSAFVIFGLASADGVTSYTGDGTSGIYIWGAQAVEGTSALPYQKTETRLNIPRLDYSLGGCPNILLEPQRTNLALQSSSFDNASWLKDGTVTANTTISPSGVQDADTWTTAAASNVIFQNVSVTQNTNYVFSFYVKRGTLSDLRYLIYNNSAGSNIVAPTSYYSQTSSTQWVRISVAFTTPSGCTSVRIYPHVGTSGITPGTVFFWGAQLEAGAYATSYIPTTSASVTRNGDLCSKTGITSLIGQTEGTIFFDGVINGCQNSSANILSSERNTNASFFMAYVKATNRISAGIYSSATEPATFSGGSVAIGSRFKAAYAYKSGSSTLYVNGVQIGTSSTVFTLPNTIDDLYISDQTTYFSFGESIRNNVSALWKERLTNDQLAQLTTL